MTQIHIPVMKSETLDLLINKKDGIYVDCTIGFGGHSKEILNRINNKGILIGMDLDPYALSKANEKLSDSSEKKFSLHNISYKEFPTILSEMKIKKVDGFLIDLGISSYQVDSAHRGFSFTNNGPLDMRFNQSNGYTAKKFLNKISEKKLADIIKYYGDQSKSKKIAKAILEKINSNKINTTFDLKNCIQSITKSNDLKIVSKVFQSIRIALNDEFENLKSVLKKMPKFLNKGGRIAIISFHSIEDRIVKHYFKNNTLINVEDYFDRKKINQENLKVLTKKPVTPSNYEVQINPRSRSAKLRVAEKI
tara:strand:+ start:1247 stop:2167 length:921 start_codon:yes stop_codon:yes gene_type:complete